MASLAIDSILLILRNQIQFGWILSSLFVKIKTVCECVRVCVCVCVCFFDFPFLSFKCIFIECRMGNHATVLLFIAELFEQPCHSQSRLPKVS